MRISDWSSDVCSSDLSVAQVALASRGIGVEDVSGIADEHVDAFVADRGQRRRGRGLAQDRLRVEFPVTAMENAAIGGGDHQRAHFQDRVRGRNNAQPERRAAAHTSELQSRMRNSYAGFGMTKQTHN